MVGEGAWESGARRLSEKHWAAPQASTAALVTRKRTHTALHICFLVIWSPQKRNDILLFLTTLNHCIIKCHQFLIFPRTKTWPLRLMAGKKWINKSLWLSTGDFWLQFSNIGYPKPFQLPTQNDLFMRLLVTSRNRWLQWTSSLLFSVCLAQCEM